MNKLRTVLNSAGWGASTGVTHEGKHWLNDVASIVFWRSFLLAVCSLQYFWYFIVISFLFQLIRWIWVIFPLDVWFWSLADHVATFAESLWWIWMSLNSKFAYLFIYWLAALVHSINWFISLNFSNKGHCVGWSLGLGLACGVTIHYTRI